ncbi:MAG: 2,4-dihydroxyhept-2-ene-1,7-dioic acid aldolase, partial [Candidatus Marinimicrobia bacterium]|nr:2,4-dihydroxyhept-2-ene-1,7-dioic acid aldolase [Candidatus Neomarinimicrobiota bacterium]
CGDHVVHPDQQLLEKRIQQGYRFIAFGTDAVFLYKSSQMPDVSNK